MGRAISWRRLLTVAVALALGTTVMTFIQVSSSGASPKGKPAKPPAPYYLSLGDSLSVGYQPNSTSACPNSTSIKGCTTQGYTNDLYKNYKKRIKGLKAKELGCPGETSSTMIGGGICTYADGNQLAQAENFIEHNDVAFITIDIGANDVDLCADYVLSKNSATGEPDPDYATDVDNCVNNGVTPETVGADGYPASDYGVSSSTGGIAGINTNLPTILSGLENAETSSALSKGAAIYGMSYYDPFLALYLLSAYTGPSGFAEQSTSLATSLNSALSSDYAGASGPGQVTVADVQDLFKTTDGSSPSTYTPVNPNAYTLSTDPVNVLSVCAWTWECSIYENIHANKSGYAAIATSFEEVMGYLP
jgi:hypothetical protein